MTILFRTLALALLLAVPAAPALAGGNELVFSWQSNCGPLNPHLYSPNQMYAQNMLYEPLVRYAEGGRIVPWLAERWDISPDGRTYTFKLELSTDGKAWKEVAGNLNNAKPATAEGLRLNFEPTAARYARLTVVKNSANFAVHVQELKLFAVSTL